MKSRYCEPCRKADPTHVITVKLPARKSSRKRTQQDYANLNSGLLSDPNRWTKILEGKDIKDDSFKRMKGAEVSMEWLQNGDDAMKEPIVILEPDGLGMRMPEKEDFGVEDVARIVGEDTFI
jgi:F-box and leucine-rich repeat protein 10/11